LDDLSRDVIGEIQNSIQKEVVLRSLHLCVNAGSWLGTG